MHTTFEYRSYQISHDGSAFVACPKDEEPLQLRSKHMLRLTRAIDTLWNALEGTVPMPTWLGADSDLVDIDAAAEAMLVVDRPLRAAPAFPLEPMVGIAARAAA